MTAVTTLGNGFEPLRGQLQTELQARLPEHIERLQWTHEQIETAQRDGLRALLAHAIEYSPFHRRRLGDINPSRFDLSDLSRLPVMTKAEMMESLDDIFTDRRLNWALVEEALAATTNEPVPILGEYTALASGGVSGLRGVFVADSQARADMILAALRPMMARLASAGGPPSGGLTMAVVAAASAVHATGSIPAWAAAGDLPIRARAVPVTLPLPEIVDRLNALQPQLLYGYASMLARLAEEQRAGRLQIKPISVNSNSEMLSSGQRAAIAEAFGAPIVEGFGCSEGLMGNTAPNDRVFVFTSDLCIVELVDAEDQPVPLGVPSARVLLTNLYNRIQPLIRYQLMDNFVRQPDAPDHGHLRATVRGRADELLRYDGVDVHPLVVRSVMVRSPAILDYQVRQTPRGIDVDTLAVVPVDCAHLADQLSRALAEAGLHDPAVTVRLVDRLERLPDTGKVRRFLPLAEQAAGERAAPR